MKYKVGMYGGSFDPLHIGHINNIVRAAAMCEELYIVISWAVGRESTSPELRYRWILNVTKHIGNVKILLAEDSAKTKQEYNDGDYWKNGSRIIKNKIGKKIDAVFCGDDYRGKNVFESLYGEDSEIIYFSREEVNISSTEIRNKPLKYWDYIPNVCRENYVKKIVVLGGESTGKSTLIQNLALSYNTNYVSEVGRDTCEYAGGEDYMNVYDLYENLLRQKINVMNAIKTSNRFVFVDTEALTTLFYANFLLNNNADKQKCQNLAKSINDITDWDLVLFLEPTVKFVQDGTRNEKIEADREKYSAQIKELLLKNGVDFICISGDYNERFDTAKRIINHKFL